jgi:hypothetical protein
MAGEADPVTTIRYGHAADASSPAPREQHSLINTDASLAFDLINAYLACSVLAAHSAEDFPGLSDWQHSSTCS